MDLLLESKKGNKEAFKELTKNLEIKIYKTARYYFTTEEDVLAMVKKAKRDLFIEIINAKTENQVTFWVIKFLVRNCKRRLRIKMRNPMWRFYVSSAENKSEYDIYRKNSLEEEFITSLDKELRLISILYYYDELTVKEISKILRKSEYSVNKVISEARGKLYEMVMNEEVKKYNDYV